MKRKKILATILALAMALSLAACGSPSSNETPSSNNESKDSGTEQSASVDNPTPEAGYVADNITVTSSSDGSTFDPFASFVNWGDATLTGLIFERLILNDFDYNVYNVIAKDIHQVDDTHWALEIWDCVYDTAGNQITMDDVIWGYEQCIASGNLGAIPKFVAWEKEDDYNGVMELSAPFGSGDFDKHFGNVGILSKKTYEEVAGGDMTTNPIGTGPYKLKEGGYTVGNEVILEVNEDYWGAKAGVNNPFAAQNFKTITYEIIQDASSRAIALEMGTVDLCDNMEALDIKNLDTNQFNLIDCPVRPPVAIVLNANEDSILQNKELRQAILYGLDNAAISASLGLPSSPVYGLQPAMVDAPSSWSSGREYYDYNPDKTAELLEQAGYSGEEITLMYVSSTVTDAAAIQIQSQLKKVGIAIKLDSVDQTTAMQYQYDPAKWDIRIATLGGGAYMSQTVKSWWSGDVIQHVPEGSGWNFSLTADAELDALYEALRDDPTEANINAWAEHFDEQAFGYAICSYALQTACTNAYQPTIQGNSGWSVVPNAFVAAG